MAGTLHLRKKPVIQVAKALRASPVRPAAISRIATKPAKLNLTRPAPPGGGKVLNKRKAPAPSPPAEKELGKRKKPGVVQEEQPNEVYYEDTGSGGGSSGGGGGQASSNADEREVEEAAALAAQEEYRDTEGDIPMNTEEGTPPAAVAPPVKKSIWTHLKEWLHDIFAGEEDITSPITSSHIHADYMHTASIVINQNGCHYVVTKIPCPAAGGRSGKVNIHGEGPVWLQSAAVKTKNAIRVHTKDAKREKTLISLVNRSRAGDQNAMALIALVRDNAAKGNPAARRSAKFMRNYIAQNPMQSEMGAELGPPVRFFNPTKEHATLAFANGFPLEKPVIGHVASSFGNDSNANKQTFLMGVKKWGSTLAPDLRRQANPIRLSIFEAGQVIGKARAIQQVRKPGTPLASFDPMIGWELGE